MFFSDKMSRPHEDIKDLSLIENGWLQKNDKNILLPSTLQNFKTRCLHLLQMSRFEKTEEEYTDAKNSFSAKNHLYPQTLSSVFLRCDIVSPKYFFDKKDKSLTSEVIVPSRCPSGKMKVIIAEEFKKISTYKFSNTLRNQYRVCFFTKIPMDPSTLSAALSYILKRGLFGKVVFSKKRKVYFTHVQLEQECSMYDSKSSLNLFFPHCTYTMSSKHKHLNFPKTHARMLDFMETPIMAMKKSVCKDFPLYFE